MPSHRLQTSLPSSSSSTPQPDAVSFCCNVTINFKGRGLRDEDTPRLIRSFEEKFCVNHNRRGSRSTNIYQSNSNNNNNNKLSEPSDSGSKESTSASGLQSRPQCNDATTSSNSSSGSNPSATSNTVYFVSLDLSENYLSCSGIERLAVSGTTS